jgi:hypothetical protein
MERALTILADGGMPDVAKPLTGLGSGVMELAPKHRGDAFQVIYALQFRAVQAASSSTSTWVASMCGPDSVSRIFSRTSAISHTDAARGGLQEMDGRHFV